ncbi:MAG: hypothetical protein M0R80_19465 [Proteobacteria bacterium]|jgi:hypothetical protein|nr:hypothetical protein [Pseudomonadota bacterium]
MMKPVLAIAAVLFIAVLAFRFVRGLMLGRRVSAAAGRCEIDGDADPELKRLVGEAISSGKPREGLRQIERRATSGEASSRATHHCAAGNLALTEMKRPGLAVALFLRALREDPTCLPALERLREILMAQKRYRRLEQTCWELLSRLDDADVGTPIWFRAWTVLAATYSTSPRQVRRADAIRKMLASFEADDEGEEANGARQR